MSRILLEDSTSEHALLAEAFSRWFCCCLPPGLCLSGVHFISQERVVLRGWADSDPFHVDYGGPSAHSCSLSLFFIQIILNVVLPRFTLLLPDAHCTRNPGFLKTDKLLSGVQQSEGDVNPPSRQLPHPALPSSEPPLLSHGMVFSAHPQQASLGCPQCSLMCSSLPAPGDKPGVVQRVASPALLSALRSSPEGWGGAQILFQ